MLLDLISKKENVVKEFNIGDKIGYAFGDFGCGIFFGFISGYLMIFYTDVLGISAGAITALFIVARTWDAINDPIMGVLVDRRKPSKYGRFRPYVIKFGIPMAIMGILTFTAIPNIPSNLKVPYAYVTYILFGMFYTAVNIPYGSLASVISKEPAHKTALSAFRSLGTISANLLVALIVPRIVFNSDKVVTAQGFTKCVTIFAILSIIAFILNFRLTRERITHESINTKNSIFQIVKMLMKNRAFIGIALSSFTMMSAMLTVSSLNVYMYKDYFKNPGLISIAGLITITSVLISIPCAGIIVKKFGKKETSVAAAALSAAVCIVMFFIPHLPVKLYMAGSFVSSIGTGIISTIIWALVSDAIDYQEYISKERNEGTVYASYSLARKLAQATSGGIGGLTLFILGYKVNAATQISTIGQGIKNITLGVASVGYLLTTLILLFVYNLSKKKLEEVNIELEKRRNA